LLTVLLGQASKQYQIDLAASGIDYMARIRKILRTTRKHFHRDEVFPADYSQPIRRVA
jgi:hypothetical protein